MYPLELIMQRMICLSSASSRALHGISKLGAHVCIQLPFEARNVVVLEMLGQYGMELGQVRNGEAAAGTRVVQSAHNSVSAPV